MQYSAVPFDPAAAGMLTVAEARARLALNATGAEFTFWTCDAEVEALYEKGWADGELTRAAQAWLRVGGRLFQLTRQAAQQLGSTCKVNKRFQEFIPPAKLSDLVTWALREGLHKRNGDGLELKLLLAGEGEPGPFLASPVNADCKVPLAVAQTRATVQPFSNVTLLDTVTLAIRAKFGHALADGACVDFKLFDDLEHTSFRVIVPGVQQEVDGEAWCYGIEVSNSAIGAKQLVVAGYVFSLEALAGVTDLEHQAGGFKRRGSTPEAAYAWAGEASRLVLDGAATAFEGLRVLAASDVDAEYGAVLGQYWHESPISADLKLAVTAALEGDPDPVSVLTLVRTVSVEANPSTRSWRDVRALHDLAGHMLHQGGGMCRGQLENGCRRLLAPGYGTHLS